jgi:hypothetical protein
MPKTDVIAKCGGRKFILCVMFVLLGTGLLIAGKIQSVEWVEVGKYIIFYYVAANVAQKATAKPELGSNETSA